MTNEEKLKELIPAYAKDKEEEKRIKDRLDSNNTEIKSLLSPMYDGTSAEYEVDGYVAKYTVQHRESMDEDKVLSLLKKHNVNQEGLIKTIEKVDMDVLEDLMYREELSAALLNDLGTCLITKDVPVLKVSKAKRKNKEEE